MTLGCLMYRKDNRHSLNNVMAGVHMYGTRDTVLLNCFFFSVSDAVIGGEGSVFT